MDHRLFVKSSSVQETSTSRMYIFYLWDVMRKESYQQNNPNFQITYDAYRNDKISLYMDVEQKTFIQNAL